MRWYRAQFIAATSTYKKGAEINVISEKFGDKVVPTKGGDMAERHGSFTTTEALKRGSYVICDDNGRLQPYQVTPSKGMGEVNRYTITETGLIRGARERG